MKIQEVIELDFREEKSRKLIQQELKKIKPLSKFSSDVPLERIEFCAKVLCENYSMFLQNIGCDTRSCREGILYNLSVVDRKDLKKIIEIYAISLYELFAKTVIALYAITRKN